jgi:hypothetical protein
MDESKKKEKRKKKLYGDRWETIRRQVYLRDGFRCVMCGKKTKLHAHHVVPVQVSHDNSLNNLVSVCGHCHRKLESIGFKILESGGHKDDVRRVEFRMIAEAQIKLKTRANKHIGENNESRGDEQEHAQVITEGIQETERTG